MEKFRKPSEERIWEKYYSKQALTAKIPEMTMYEYALSCNTEYMDQVIVKYYGNDMTYNDFFKSECATDNAAAAFKKAGIKKGDRVSLCSLSIPEVYYAIYALNKIGAVTNAFDPRASDQIVEHFLNESKSTYLIMLDALFPKFAGLLGKTSIKKVIIVSPFDSLPKIKRSILTSQAKQKQLTNDIYSDKSSYISWNEFASSGSGYKGKVAEAYEKDSLAFIVHTGGTTGIPKGVGLSNEAFNACNILYTLSGMEYYRNEPYLHVMPPWIAYSFNRFHLTMIEGMPAVIIPKFEPEELPKLLIKNKIAHFVGVPVNIETIMNSEEFCKKGKKHTRSLCVGGDYLGPTVEENANKFLASINPRYKCYKGYSLSELGSATIVSSYVNNKFGSPGIPVAQYNMKIINPDNGEELGYNESGEICLTGPSMMLSYENNPEATDAIKKIDENGVAWIKTGDRGYIDEDGFLFIEGRYKRIIVTHDSFKIFPFSIENIITSHQAVSQCAVVGIRDIEHAHGQKPIAHIVLKPEYKGSEQSIEDEIKKLCFDSALDSYAYPVKYIFRDSFPLTLIGKIDHDTMEAENNTY